MDHTSNVRPEKSDLIGIKSATGLVFVIGGPTLAASYGLA
jgi:hypothetical protein